MSQRALYTPDVASPFKPDLNVAQAFLKRLAPNATRFTFQVIPDSKKSGIYAQIRHGSLEELFLWLTEMNNKGAGIFVTVNETDFKGRAVHNILSVRSVFVDLDGSPIEPVLKFNPVPHLIFETSPGRYHAYWFVDGVELSEFTAIQTELISLFAADPSIKDLPRVMRVPGFFHLKGKPFQSRLYQQNDIPNYTAEQIFKALPTKAESPKRVKTQAIATEDANTKTNRNVSLMSLAGTMRHRGMSEGAIYSALLVENKEKFFPPLEDSEVREIAKSVCRYNPNEFSKNSKGEIMANHQDNIRLALSQLEVFVSNNVFAQRLLIRREDGPDELLDDPAFDRLWLEIDEVFHFRPSRKFLETVVADYARTFHSFHPVCDYLDSLTWDGEPRLDNWLIEYGGATDNDYTRAVGRIPLIAAVRRVRKPGTKFDEMTVIEGEQGIRKSSALAALCKEPDWFTDDLPLNVPSKEIIERTAGKWIVEAGELAGMRKMDIEHLKSFLSRQYDNARLSYERRATEIGRNFIVMGTTNSKSYLKDGTGNRRFWPVRVTGFDVDRLKADRDQLWAEAAHREAKGESIRLNPKLWEEASLQQENRRLEDPWERIIFEAVGNCNGKVPCAEIWRLLGIEAGRQTQHDNIRIGEVMSHLGFVRKRLTVGTDRTYCYVRGSEAEQEVQLSLNFSPP
jgi:hypothetical protein